MSTEKHETVTITKLEHSVLRASNDEARRIADERDKLRASLGEMVRIVEAMRITTGLGENQMARLRRAREILDGYVNAPFSA